MKRNLYVAWLVCGMVIAPILTAKAQKDLIRIALVAPLSIPANLADPSKQNHAMAELLAGAMLASQDLEKVGPVKLFVYDTHKNSDTLRHILALPELATMDLIIGPVYAAGSKELAVFALANNIPLVNPLTNSHHWDEPNQSAFLAEPDYVAMATAVLGLQEGLPGHKVATLFGTYPKDSALAGAFEHVAAKANLRVVFSKKVAKNSAANLAKFIKEAELDSTSILFVPNNEPLVRQQLLPAMELNRCRALVVTYGEWLEETELPIEKFERNRILFLYPGYVDLHSPTLKDWRKRLTQLSGLPPTEITCKGYDVVFSLGRVLLTCKPEARKNFLKEFSPILSDYSSGFDFADGQSNAKVAIYAIRQGKLVLQ